MKMILTVVNIGQIFIGATICFAGLYASGYSIAHNSRGKSWACSIFTFEELKDW